MNRTAGPTELHVALEIPRHTARQIFHWVKEQHWPEETQLQQASDYHITLLYADSDNGTDPKWINHLEQATARINGVSAFPSREKGGYAYVLTIDAPEVKDKADELTSIGQWMGLDVATYPGGFKPHLTVGYGPSSHLTGIKAPDFEFDIGPSSVSPARPNKTAESVNARTAYDPESVKVLDHLSISNVAHNLHYRFEQGGMDAQAATDYAKRLLSMVGYQPEEMNLQAALQAWQQLYPQDKVLPAAQQSGALQAPPTTPTESWGYGTTSGKISDWHDRLSQTLSRPLYHWLDASDIHDWMDPSHTGPGHTYLTGSGDDPATSWNDDVPHYDNPVRLTIDPEHLDPNSFDQTYNGWLGNYLYHGAIPPQAVSDIKAFKRPGEWDNFSTVPTQVNNPDDHWPEWGQVPPDRNRDIQFSNDWQYH